MKLLNLRNMKRFLLFAVALVCLTIFAGGMFPDLTNLEVGAQTTPRLCFQPSAPMASPPPVLFRVSSSATVSGVPSDQCSDFRSSELTGANQGQFTVTSSSGGRSATMTGNASAARLTGSFSSLVNEQIIGYDHGSSTQGLVDIYVRGFRTKYVLNATFNEIGRAHV